ncbi:hypothetical protein RhiirA1_445639 [Rhizophagus irregularis]|uniref:Uncharacterized protein n=1 Tax=Rhizophagus irregularis TaxID=588596 RepID=A0A2N0R6C5_9GLOM|nr:hypothetical protein RhiirA1_445639 [Rhizophagus irregularis]
MACSKVFSGDLPELTDAIMQYLRKDLSTLYSCENILFYIKEYIMKKERVKYLAIVFDDELNNEIFHLKDEVNEFKLHNIIVKRFSDLYIDAYNFVNDLNK